MTELVVTHRVQLGQIYIPEALRHAQHFYGKGRFTRDQMFRKMFGRRLPEDDTRQAWLYRMHAKRDNINAAALLLDKEVHGIPPYQNVCKDKHKGIYELDDAPDAMKSWRMDARSRAFIEAQVRRAKAILDSIERTPDFIKQHPRCALYVAHLTAAAGHLQITQREANKIFLKGG